MQYSGHSGVSIDEDDQRQNELDDNGQHSDGRLSDRVRPFRVDSAVSAGQDGRRRRHVRHVVSRPDYPRHRHRQQRLYDTRCYFNVRSKDDTSRLNLPDGNDN